MKPFSSSFWLNSLFYTFLQRFALFLFGAVSYIVMAHQFEPETFSHWALFVVLISLIEGAKNGLLRNPAIKFFAMPQYEDRRNEVESSSFVVNLLFSVLVCLLFFAFGDMLARWLQSDTLHELIPGGIVIILINIFFSHFEMLLQARFRFEKIFAANFTRQFLFFSGIILLRFFPEYFLLGNILLVQIFSTIIGTLLIYYFASANQQGNFQFNRQMFVHMLQFGKYTFGTNLFAQAGRNLDQLLTAMLLDPFQGRLYVSFYNVVNRINNMMDVPALAAADVAFPKNVETMRLEGSKRLKEHFEKMAGAILAVMLPVTVLMLLIPKIFLLIIGGKDYYPAAPLLQIAMLFGWVRPLSYHFGAMMDAIGKPQLNFKVNALFFGVSLVLHVFFIMTTGGIGGAIAIAILYLLMMFIMYRILHRQLGVEVLLILQAIKSTYVNVFKRLV